MERLVFYGKGGIGKSTLSANVAVALCRSGRRVLHVGCDPKHDSTVGLMAGEMIPTVLEREFDVAVRAEDIVRVSRSGVHCVEAGGPQAGVGCAGRGISRTVEIFGRADLLSPARYDVVTFDLLGDVVCGGFAAPLRQGVGEKVVIVSSEEVMALYAANNIARAVVNYASNGIACAGMILNVRDGVHARAPAERFAELIGVPILAVVPRDPLFREAEYRRMTVTEHAPDSAVAAQLHALAERLVAIPLAECAIPTPLSDQAFYSFAQHKFDPPPDLWHLHPRPAQAPRPQIVEPDSLELARQGYRRDLRAGMLAVRRGLVRPEEALERLQRSHPGFTRSLSARDLVT